MKLPNVTFIPFVGEWCVDVRRLKSTHIPQTGITLFGGLLVQFGPICLFWRDDR